MTQLEFIPLKSPDGAPCGHARVQGGFVDVCMRGAVRGQAFVLTQSGYTAGLNETRIRVDGRVQAVALHENGRLVCAGFARGASMTLPELRRKLAALTPAPVQKAAKADAACAVSAPTAPPADNPVPATTHTEAPAHNVLDSDRPLPADLAVESRRLNAFLADAPADGGGVSAQETIAETLARLSREDGAFLPAVPHETRCAPVPAPDAAIDDDGERASLLAQLRRAEAVLRRISPPEYVRAPNAFASNAAPAPADAAVGETACALEAPPLPDAATPCRAPMPPPAPDTQECPHTPDAQACPPDAPDRQRTDRPAPAKQTPRTYAGYRPVSPPVRETAREQWHREADALLCAEPSQAVPVENPFPHIFPGAVFTRDDRMHTRGTLCGQWTRRGERFHITAVPGEYRPQPPKHLPGFTRYIRTLQGGYWIRVRE